MTLVRWPISWNDHVQDIYPFSAGPVICCSRLRSFMVFFPPKARTTVQILPPPSSTPFPPFGSWCYVSPRKLKPSVSECCLYFPVATRANPCLPPYRTLTVYQRSNSTQFQLGEYMPPWGFLPGIWLWSY